VVLLGSLMTILILGGAQPEHLRNWPLAASRCDRQVVLVYFHWTAPLGESAGRQTPRSQSHHTTESAQIARTLARTSATTDFNLHSL
jgi:hypothetical protein